MNGDYEVVWDGRGPLTAALERDYEAMRDGSWDVIYWPPPVVFDYDRFIRKWGRLDKRVLLTERRCRHCQRWFSPKRCTTFECSERCAQALTRRCERLAEGRKVRELRRSGECSRGHVLRVRGTNKGECATCKSLRDKARRAARREVRREE